MNIKESTRTLLFSLGRLFYYNRKSKVLYYHDVSSVDGKDYTLMSTPYELFVEHLTVLPKYGRIVSDITESNGQFQIAFDDGFRGVYDNKELFLSRGIYPTIFVANNLVGKEGYMDEAQLKELSSIGFNIQSHSVSHCDLSKLGREQLIYELSGSKHYLEELLGKEINSICCPMGLYNDMVIQEAQKLGYKHVYLSYPEPYETGNFIEGRYFCQSLSVFQFRLLLYGGMDILKSRYQKQHYNSMN